MVEASLKVREIAIGLVSAPDRRMANRNMASWNLDCFGS